MNIFKWLGKPKPKYRCRICRKSKPNDQIITVREGMPNPGDVMNYHINKTPLPKSKIYYICKECNTIYNPTTKVPPFSFKPLANS